MKKTLVGVTVGLGAIFLILALVVATGYGYIGIKNPQQSVAVTSSVCDEKVINQYNQVYSYTPTEEMRIAIDRIKEAAGYQNDATCQYILTTYYSAKRDKKMAGEHLTATKKLLEKGNGVDIRLEMLLPIYLIEQSINQLDAPADGTEGQAGAG